MGGLDILKETVTEGSIKDDWEIADLVETSKGETSTSEAETLDSRLSKLVNRHPIMLFMKGLPSNPQCGFSRQVSTVDHNRVSQKMGFCLFSIIFSLMLYFSILQHLFIRLWRFWIRLVIFRMMPSMYLRTRKSGRDSRNSATGPRIPSYTTRENYWAVLILFENSMNLGNWRMC